MNITTTGWAGQNRSPSRPPPAWLTKYAQGDLKKRNSRATNADNPSDVFPGDGQKSDWIEMKDNPGIYRIKYTAGPKDIKWLEGVDRNYINRIVKEARDPNNPRQLAEEELQDVKEMQDKVPAAKDFLSHKKTRQPTIADFSLRSVLMTLLPLIPAFSFALLNIILTISNDNLSYQDKVMVCMAAILGVTMVYRYGIQGGLEEFMGMRNLRRELAAIPDQLMERCLALNDVDLATVHNAILQLPGIEPEVGATT